MAIVLIFICSMIGLFMAAVQIVVLENGVLQAVTTYLGFAVGYPIAFFLFLWLLDTARHALTAPPGDEADSHDPAATRQAAGY
ncbi:hypothetical protein [Shimia sp. SDUM112013]|uniref:hypothetical protein n=1 Tax=Shimia sp. SDUM112013 TaxID=3136160 RepID=UPI0032EE387B